MYSLVDTKRMANKLCSMAKEVGTDDIDNVENALYHIKTICQNELNADFYRSLFRVLIDICED